MRCRTCYLAVFFLFGCSKPTAILVSPETVLLQGKGDSAQLRPTVLDQGQKPLAEAKVSFKSMTPTMAMVDDTGKVTAVSSGNAIILISAGDVSREVEVLVQIPKRIDIDPNAPMLMLGITKAFKATVYNDRDQPMIAGEVRWLSSDPSIFTVDKYGNVKTLQEGEAKLTVFAAGISGSTPITVKHEELQEDGSLSQ